MTKIEQHFLEAVESRGKLVYYRVVVEDHTVGAVSHTPEGWRAMAYHPVWGATPRHNRVVGYGTTPKIAASLIVQLPDSVWN